MKPDAKRIVIPWSEVFFEFLSRLGQRLDFAAVERLGDGVGKAMWQALPGRRKLAAEAVANHLGLPEAEAVDLARRSFMHNGRSFLEIFLTRQSGPRFMAERVEMDEATRRIFRLMQTTQRPVVIATGHLGAWELLVGMMRNFPGRPRQVVVRRTKNPGLNAAILHMRGIAGVDIVEHRQAAMRVLRALKHGGLTAFLVDHNCGRDEAIFLPFLNDIAAVNMGPALLAVRAGALIIPSFFQRVPGGRYVWHLADPLDTTELTGERGERIAAAAEFYTRAIERYVRLAPEQWFWMHKRWKTRPPTED